MQKEAEGCRRSEALDSREERKREEIGKTRSIDESQTLADPEGWLAANVKQALRGSETSDSSFPFSSTPTGLTLLCSHQDINIQQRFNATVLFCNSFIWYP